MCFFLKNDFTESYTLDELNESFTLQEKPSKVVPLKTKVYDFVLVKVRDNYEWKIGYKLIAVCEKDSYPYVAIGNNGVVNVYKQAEFI